MSSSSQSAAPSSIFESMLDTALAEYQKKTGDDLLAHWLAAELQTCESVDGVLDILREQAKTFEQSGDQKLMKWIDPLVHVLYTFCGALGDGVSLVPITNPTREVNSNVTELSKTFRPAKVIFTGIGALLAAAKAVRASHGAIIDLFKHIENFFKRLEVYTEISLSTKMAEVLVKIVIELLSILSIATKEVKRPLAKRYFGKLLGRTDIEDALKKLESLIKEELQMVTAQTLKVVTEAKDDAGKANMGMQQDMEEVKRNVLEVKRNVLEVKRVVEEVKWTQIEKEIHKWLSPPDPTTNYNIACETHQEGTSAWFFQSKKFQDWTSNGSLLWIHGKPGSGKSILCSAIIKYVMSLRDAGQASLAFFYFDFRDKDKKQDFRNFITSLLVQLSANSTLCCEIIFRIYSTHGKGTRQPSNGALTDCLREMLSIAAQQPIYIIVDALDECPNASGMPTPREVVLDLLEGLVHLDPPNLHICVTSRPEIDIKNVLGPLASAVSLHDEIGQMKDIFDYVSNKVYADRNMRTWRDEEKKLVVGELSNKADGMFRWVFCQLEVLRRCFPANIRQTLRELPESLDETYARVLREINKTNQGHAHRMLQCLMVAVRPLLVEELAELLAFEFDGAQGGIPIYRAAWRLGNQTQAVLSTCSSLITIIGDRRSGRQVVQFSHFSVKEFLMSDRLTSALGDFSRYQILPGPAHTILTQACLGSLLHSGDLIDEKSSEKFPLVNLLVQYAARHWVEHAQFGDVASRVKDGMETLFDSDKSCFAAWIGIYDIDRPMFFWRRLSDSVISPNPNPNPLYYSVLCGFYDLVKLLAIKHPHHVNAICGQYMFPLLAALSKDYVEVAELLVEHGANVDVRESTGETILLKVLSGPRRNLVDKVKFLLKHGADVNARDDTLKSSLHLAEDMGELEVAEVLVKHKADVNFQDINGKTPLHILLEHQSNWLSDAEFDGAQKLNHARLLLEHGAEVNIQDKDSQTPLHLAIREGLSQLARILLEHGADVIAGDNNGKTPLHILSSILSESRIKGKSDVLDLARRLLKFGAEVNRRDKDNQTPLHLAICRGQSQLARILLEHGPDANAEDNDGKTPLHLLSESEIRVEGDVVDLALLLLKLGAEVNRRDKNNQTPLHPAIRWGHSQFARLLLGHDADANAEDNDGKTPLHRLSECRFGVEGDVLDLALLLLKLGAEVNRRDKENQTPLHSAIRWGQSLLAWILLERGADANAEDNDGKTPLHILSESEIRVESDVLDLALLLLKLGAEVNRRDKNNQTPLHPAIRWGHSQFAQILLGHGADVNAEDNDGKTPLHILSESFFGVKGDILDLALLLLKLGADVNRRDKANQTLLHLAIGRRQSLLAWILLERGADANAEDNDGKTPLHILSESEIRVELEGDVLDLALLLLEVLELGAAEVNRRDKNNQTPLHLAIRCGQPQLAQILLEHGADANAEDNNGETLLHILSECWVIGEGEVLDLALLLLKLGAEVNRRDKENQTPLHVAVGRDRSQLTRILLENGADPNAKNSNDKTPWCILIENRVNGGCDFVNHVRLLLEEGVGVNRRDGDNNIPLLLEKDSTTENKMGETSVQQVSRGQYSSREHGVGVTQRPLDGVDANVQGQMTPSHLQSNLDQFQIAILLIDHGAKPKTWRNGRETPLYQEIEGVNVQNKNHLTSLHLASLYGWAETVQILLDRGATGNSADALGWTPLHFLAGSEYSSWLDVRIARLLLEHGADVNAQDKDNTTPLHVASYFGRVDVVQVLLDHGATANLEKNPGLTPLHLVAESSYCFTQNGIRIAKLLLEHGADVVGSQPGTDGPISNDIAQCHRSQF